MPCRGDVSGSVLLGRHKKVRYAFPQLHRPFFEVFADERYGQLQLPEITRTGRTSATDLSEH